MAKAKALKGADEKAETDEKAEADPEVTFLNNLDRKSKIDHCSSFFI